MNKYLEGFSHKTIEQTQEFILKIQKGTLKNTGMLIGTICFWNISMEECKAETGYVLHPDFHRNGYMQEAMTKVIDFGFNKMKLKTIEAFTHRDNDSSTKLLIKNKFRHDINRKLEENSNNIVFTLSRETR